MDKKINTNGDNEQKIQANENTKKKKTNAKKFRNIFVILIAVIELVVFLSGYFVGVEFTEHKMRKSGSYNKVIDNEKSDVNEKTEKEENIDQNINSSEKTGKIDEFIEGMSLDEKIYQLMFVTPEAITKVGEVKRAGDTTREALKKYPVGGIIYFSANFDNAEQTREMISNTQKFSKIPLFIGVDEEGGIVSRVGSNPEMGTTKHPPMKEIGESKDVNKAYTIGETLAKELTGLGFNVDFAPDADVIVNEKNTEIGDRSFGKDADLVSEMVKNVVKGMQENGISSTIKHFPGHGSTSVDSHTGYSESPRTIEELRNCEFKPFKAGIEAGAEFVMISHMTLKNAIKEDAPASLSEEVITGMLKEELGYEGIILTDSMSMGAITDNYSSAEAAVKAINAGVDMLLMPSDIDGAFKGVKEAVDSGKITEERIDESVRKILSLKVRKNMIK